ncbi:MAG: phosphatase PAP2 family protein [Clostridiales bacterium]|nr:phosphatase PAP2 family protein [Clostridiales bacterium]
MKTLKSNLILTGALFLIFIAFTLLVKFVGVCNAGPFASEIGFCSLNLIVASAIGFNETFYKISEVFGFVTFIVIGCFVILGLYQLIKGKSFKKVDAKIYALACFYVLTFIFYLAFEVIVINYRPVLMEGELEASYPSSHTLLSLCVISSALILVKDFISNKKLQIGAYAVGGFIMLATVVTRLLSGAHWLTDIIGGIILSCALISLFYTAVTFIREKQSEKSSN